MNTAPPLAFTWDGEAFYPRHPRLADKHFVVGETYQLVPHEERSSATHAHFFALVNEAHRNLPEAVAERFPTSESLRKWCLIRAGYRDERSVVCASKAEAQRVAAFVRPIDSFAVVVVSGATVSVYTAKSQSMRAMDKKTFAASKEAVLGVLAELVGVSKDALSANAGQAA